MQTSQVLYPVWHILPDRRADNPDALREAIKFLAKHTLFHLNQYQDAKHLAALFAATDLARSGLSQEEIKMIVAYENAHPLLFVGRVNSDNCYWTLKNALMESNCDAIADCLVFLSRHFRDSKYVVIDSDDKISHTETNILIETIYELSKARVKIYKKEGALTITFSSYRPLYETAVRYISLFVPVKLRLGRVSLDDQELIWLQKRLPRVTLSS